MKDPWYDNKYTSAILIVFCVICAIGYVFFSVSS